MCFKLLVAKNIDSFFEVGCCEVKMVLRVAAINLAWINFIFTILSALAFFGWHFVKTHDL